MRSHYHPPRCRSALCISDAWIKCQAGYIVKRAEQRALRMVKQGARAR